MRFCFRFFHWLNKTPAFRELRARERVKGGHASSHFQTSRINAEKEKKKERNEPPSATLSIRPGRIVGSGARGFFAGRVQQEAHDLCRQSRHVGVCISPGNTVRVRFEFLCEIAGAGAAALPASILHPSSLALAPSYREREDGRRRIVLPILPSSMTLGDDHREGANVLLPPALPFPVLSAWVPSRFVAPCAPSPPPPPPSPPPPPPPPSVSSSSFSS